jgi:thiol:disulfide interchange protein DsbD
MRNPIEYLRFLWLCMLVHLPVWAMPIPHGTVEFVAESQWITPGRQTNFALNFHIEKGWHIYWVNPGDSGEPPRIEWHLPAGLSAKEIEWPAPRRIVTSTIVDFGYVDTVTLLIPVSASTTLPANRDVQVGGELRVLVCREVCIPGKAQLSLTIPIKSQTPEVDAQTNVLFAAARKTLPRKAPSDWEINVSDLNDSFVLTAKIGRVITRATFFPVEESQVDNAAPQKFMPLVGGFRLTLRKSDQLLKPISRLKGVLELSANQTYMIDAVISAAPVRK